MVLIVTDPGIVTAGHAERLEHTLQSCGLGVVVFEEVREQFNDKELADLTMAIAAINAWNRMAISFRALPGGYQPGQFNHLLERQAH